MQRAGGLGEPPNCRPRHRVELRRAELRAGDGIRTHDNHVGNVVLYQLSYTRSGFAVARQFCREAKPAAFGSARRDWSFGDQPRKPRTGTTGTIGIYDREVQPKVRMIPVRRSESTIIGLSFSDARGGSLPQPLTSFGQKSCDHINASYSKGLPVIFLIS